MWDAQDGYQVRFDWGLSGARAIAGSASVVAVVDVLSFTTALSVAADQNVEVFPYRWRDSTAEDFARRHDAVLAVGRSQAGSGEVSLSPASIRRAGPLQRLVLPSPNGSTIAHALGGPERRVIGVSLRNRVAAAVWTADHLSRHRSSSVAVVAAGEQWPDGTLRPAVEDLWGAGGFIAALLDQGIDGASPEAAAASAAFDRARPGLRTALAETASGRELCGMGFPQDVHVAVEVDSSGKVPVLVDDRFTPVPFAVAGPGLRK